MPALHHAAHQLGAGAGETRLAREPAQVRGVDVDVARPAALSRRAREPAEGGERSVRAGVDASARLDAALGGRRGVARGGLRRNPRLRAGRARATAFLRNPRISIPEAARPAPRTRRSRPMRSVRRQELPARRAICTGRRNMSRSCAESDRRCGCCASRCGSGRRTSVEVRVARKLRVRSVEGIHQQRELRRYAYSRGGRVRLGRLLLSQA